MHRLVEGRNVPNDVIGGEHEQQRIGRPPSGSAALRAAWAARAMAGAVLRPAGSSTIACGSTPSWRSCSATRKRCASLHTTTGARRRQALEPQRGLLDHGALAREREKLLRVELAREGPKARAGAAGKNDWGEHGSYRFRFAARPAAPRPIAW